MERDDLNYIRIADDAEINIKIKTTPRTAVGWHMLEATRRGDDEGAQVFLSLLMEFALMMWNENHVKARETSDGFEFYVSLRKKRFRRKFHFNGEESDTRMEPIN